MGKQKQSNGNAEANQGNTEENQGKALDTLGKAQGTIAKRSLKGSQRVSKCHRAWAPRHFAGLKKLKAPDKLGPTPF